MATQGTGTVPADGKWGTIMINVPTGQYVVVTAITFKKGTTTQLINSPTSVVNVP